jgi:hypothetical protein
MFWPLFLAGSERLRNNRRMTDAPHNQHSEIRRSDRDRIVTTEPSRFQPARPAPQGRELLTTGQMSTVLYSAVGFRKARPA